MRLGQTSAIIFLSRLGSSVLGFLATVYFARYLGSEVLGVYFLAGAMAAWLKLGTNVGIPLAVTKRVSEQNDKHEHVIAGFLLISAGLVLVSVPLYVFRDIVNQYLGAPLYHLVILLLAAQVAYGFMGAVIRGEELVHVEGILRIVQTFTRVVLQVVTVFVGLGVVGLLLGEVIAFVLIAGVGTALLIIYFGRSVMITFPEREHFSSIVDFAKYSVLGNVQGRAYNLMDTIVLGVFVPSGLIGVYGICWNISAMLEIFAKSISSSFFPEMSKLSSEDERKKVASRLNDALAFAGLLIIPGFVGAIIIGEGILNIYGKEFRKGYVILVLLVGSSLFHSYQKQFVNTMDAVNRPELSFKVNAFFVVTNIGMNFVLVYLYGWTGAAVATVTSVALSMVLAYRMIRSILVFTVPYGEIYRQTFASLVMGALVVTVVVGLQSIGVNPYRVVPVLFTVCLGVFSYFGCLIYISTRVQTVVSDNLPAKYNVADKIG